MTLQFPFFLALFAIRGLSHTGKLWLWILIAANHELLTRPQKKEKSVSHQVCGSSKTIPTQARSRALYWLHFYCSLCNLCTLIFHLTLLFSFSLPRKQEKKTLNSNENVTLLKGPKSLNACGAPLIDEFIISFPPFPHFSLMAELLTYSSVSISRISFSLSLHSFDHR